MNKIHFESQVNADGSITIPAFVARGLGYEPHEGVSMTLPTNQYLCDCSDNALFIGRCCSDFECAGYTSDGDALNIPAKLLSDAEIPMGEDISILVADGALVIVAAEEALEELPIELCCLLNELGVSPMSVTYPAKGGKG